MTHDHILTDSDLRFRIDPISRGILTDNKKLKFMKGDHNFERHTFEIPQYVDGHDMSSCNDIRINYENVSAENRNDVSKGPYKVTDAHVEDGKLVFSWLISGNATKYAGTLNFSISFRCITGSIIDYSWSTDPFKGIIVSDVIVNDSNEVVETYTDILAEWEQRLINAAPESGSSDDQYIWFMPDYSSGNDSYICNKTFDELFELYSPLMDTQACDVKIPRVRLLYYGGILECVEHGVEAIFNDNPNQRMFVFMFYNVYDDRRLRLTYYYMDNRINISDLNADA